MAKPSYRLSSFRSWFCRIKRSSRSALCRGLSALRQCIGADELQALRRVVAVDLLHIELAHEVDGFLGNHLARHHDRKARRVRNDEVGRDQIRTILEAPVYLGVV